MTDLVRLGLVVDSNGFVRAKRDMDGFRKSASDTTKQTDGMGKTMSSTNTIAAAFGRTLGLISASLVTTGIVRYADAWTNVENRLKIVTDSTTALAAATDGVVQVALRSHAALEETASLYSTLARYAGDLVEDESELLRITETLNKSFAVSGAGAAEQAGAIRQLSQALASGALRGDEFNSINENAPRIMDAVAASLNLTKGELREFAAQGGITAEIVINAVRGMAGEIDADFSSMDRTMGQFWQNASTNITQFIGSSDSVQGAVQVFGRGIVLLSENLDVMADAALALAVILGARLTPAIIANTAAFVANTAAMTSAAGAAGILRGGLALLGGPAGVAVLGAFGIYKLVDAYIDHNREARLAKGASVLAAEGITLANEAAATYTATLVTATQSLRGYVNAGGALAGISLQMLQDMVDSKDAATGSATANDKLTESYDKVVAALKEELAVLGMSAKQKEIYQSIQKAGVALGSAEAAVIEQLIDQRYDEAEAMDEQAAALENVNDQLDRMFAMESKRSTATAGILTNIDALSREYNALLAGTEAHKAVTRELAIEAAMREAVAQGIIQEADPAYRQLIETQYDLQQAVQGFTAEADPMAESWQAALERVDSAFVDLWKSAFTGFKGFAQTLKSAFIQLLAELAHRATTQKIMISLGLGDAGVGGDILGKIPGFSSLTKNTGLDDILKGLGKGEGGFDKTALLDGFKQMGLTIAASWTGGKIGTAIGEGLFNKQAESNIGQTIGTTIGSIWGPIGAFAGSTIGSMIDTMTGGDGYKRSNAGFLVGDTPGADPEYTFNVENFTSGLEVTGFARREDQQAAMQVIESFRVLDDMVVSAGTALGGFVDQLKITGLNEEATSGSLGTFLGLGRDADLPAQMKAYVDQLIDSFVGLDQSIIDLVKNASTAEDAINVLGDATRLMQIQQVAAGMNAVEQAREQFNAQTSLSSVYQAATDQLRQLSMGYTGTIEQTAQLADAMVYQQEATYNLALAYLQVQGSVDSLFGNLSENIRMSLMSEQELYEYQRAQIEALSASIDMMTDPEMILGTADRIESQLSQVWGRLDEEQRKVMGPEFLQFIDQTNQIAQDKLRQGLDSVETTQTDINRTIQQSLEGVALQLGLSINIFAQSVNQFASMVPQLAQGGNARGREANA